MNVRFLSIWAIFLLLPLALTGQDYSLKFGEISEAEWELESYEKDPEAGAVVLFDIGSASFEEKGKYSLQLKFKRRRRIKVLKKSGYSEADITLRYINKIEEITDIKGTTYSLIDGEIVKKVVELETVFEEQINEYYFRKKFTFPDVQVGSIIEYSYEMKMPYDERFDEWLYQSDIPTIYSEYSTTVLPITEYYLITQSIEKFDVQSEQTYDIWEGYENGGIEQTKRNGVLFNKDLIKRTYGLRDIPAFGDESFMTSRNDFETKLEFKIASSAEIEAKKFNNYANIWPNLSRQMAYSGGIGGFLNTGDDIARKLIGREFDFEGKSADEKARQIIKYVKSSYSWNGYFGKFSSQSPLSLFESNKGSVADINLWLITLLNAADIDANPVVLSTRKHGKINIEYPYHRDFNYLVVLVTYDGKQYLTDGTEKLLAYNKIPPHCINEKGLVISKEKGGWVRLDNKTISKDNKLVTIDINPEDLTANVGVTIQGSEYDAYLYKKKWNGEEEEIKEDLLDKGFTEIEQVKSFNFEKNTKPYIIALKGKYEIESISDKLIVPPFLSFTLKENPFKQKERLYPVDFTYISAESYKAQIIIPEGYAVNEIPEGVSINDEVAKVDISYLQSGNQIIVNGYYTFKKAIYQSEDYAKVKEYFGVIVNKFNQELVFDKL